ncbi:hypothetical protein LEMLEM_LOCUS20605 [Lemmus lemmus]
MSACAARARGAQGLKGTTTETTEATEMTEAEAHASASGPSESRSSLNQRTVCQDPCFLCLLVFRLSKWEPTRSPQSAEAPDAVCTGYPHSGAAISSFPPTRTNASGSSIRCLASVAVFRGLPSGHLRPPLRIPGPSRRLYTLHSVSVPAFARWELGIPCLSEHLHILHSEFRVFHSLCTPSTQNSRSQTPTGPDSVQEGVLGSYQAEMPRLTTMLPG